MKKFFVLFAAAAVVLLLQLLNSCQHQLPVDYCLSEPIHLALTSTDASPNKIDGAIRATAIGGSGFKFSLNGAAYQDSGYFSGLEPYKTYRVTAKNSWGCTDTAIVDINVNDPCAGVIVAVSATKTDATLNQSNGNINASATGGSGFTFNINGGAFQTSGSFANLAAGDYTIAAKNSNGCIGTTQVIIGSSDPCAGVSVVVSSTQVNPTSGQSNGSIAASATGGSGFTYSINNGAFQPSGAFTGLAVGTYTITAKNSNGCTGIKQVTLTGIDPCAGVTITVTTTQVNPTTGQSNGSITATASGGTGFTYSIGSGSYQTGNTFSNLATGNYIITAKNSNGCTGTVTVALGSTNPCAGVTVVVSTTQTNPTTGQSNGSISATATGGTGFTFSLNNGTFQTSGTFSNLAAGTYTITAKNSNGCLGTKQVTLTGVDPCAGIAVAVATVLVHPATGQANGSITASATGGTGFTYSLNGGTYQASGVFSNLAAGSYSVSAKNSIGCLGSTQVTLIASSPCTNVSIVISTVIATTTPCVTPNTGKITVTATGSTGFTYNINGGTYQASNIFSALAAATYTIGVKDANGCTKTAATTVGATASGPLFAQMRTLITTRCSGSGCHMNGTTTSGYNFDSDCSIVSKWSQINGACITYSLKKMPISPQAALTAAEKLVITNWINAGHRYTD